MNTSHGLARDVSPADVLTDEELAEVSGDASPDAIPCPNHCPGAVDIYCWGSGALTHECARCGFMSLREVTSRA